MLEEAGYTNLCFVRGGYNAWFRIFDNKFTRRNYGEYQERYDGTCRGRPGLARSGPLRKPSIRIRTAWTGFPLDSGGELASLLCQRQRACSRVSRVSLRCGVSCSQATTSCPWATRAASTPRAPASTRSTRCGRERLELQAAGWKGCVEGPWRGPGVALFARGPGGEAGEVCTAQLTARCMSSCARRPTAGRSPCTKRRRRTWRRDGQQELGRVVECVAAAAEPMHVYGA